MRKLILKKIILLSIMLFLCSLNHAAVEPVEYGKIKEHIRKSLKIDVSVTPMESLAIRSVFSKPLYKVKINVEDGVILSRVCYIKDDEVFRIPDLQQIYNLVDVNIKELIDLLADFSIKNTNDAKTLLEALGYIYKSSFDDEKIQDVKQDGSKWILVYGKFFDSKSGFIVTTDENKKIKEITYKLKLPL